MTFFNYARENGFGVQASALYAEFMRGDITPREFLIEIIGMGGQIAGYADNCVYIAANNGIFKVDDYTVDIEEQG